MVWATHDGPVGVWYGRHVTSDGERDQCVSLRHIRAPLDSKESIRYWLPGSHWLHMAKNYFQKQAGNISPGERTALKSCY